MRFMYKSSKNLLILMSILLSAGMTFASQLSGEGSNLRLRWKTQIVRIAFSNSLAKQSPNIKSGSDVNGALQRSLGTWEEAANIKFQTSWTDKQSLSPSGNSGDGMSLITIAQTAENLLLFGNDSDSISARTRTFFNRRGLITEADIVLNPYQQFSTDGSIGTFDLEATLTHEIGHLLGLEHSFLMGAAMNAHQGKNGIYNLSAFSSRTLAQSDISAIRALYGAKADDEGCCGSVVGKITLPSGKPARDFQVWTEETETGRVIAGILTNSDGSLRIDGLPTGSYRLYSQKIGEKAGTSFPTEKLGEFEIQKGKTVDIVKRLQTKSRDFNLQYIGFNGQISELAVMLNSGKSYNVLIGGRNLDADEIEIVFSSPHISVTPKSSVKHNYGEGLSVVGFEVKISDKTPAGEYAIFVKNRNGTTESLAGSLMIESFENPWNNTLFSVNE